MTRKDCEKRIKTDPEFKALYGRNFRKAQKSFRCLIEIMRLIRPGVFIHLHHKILGCMNYEEWDVRELVPMYVDDHVLFHSVLKKGTGKFGVSVDDPSYQRLRSKDYRASHPELEQYYKEYRDANKEKAALYRKEYYLKNKEKLCEYSKQLYASKTKEEMEQIRKRKAANDRRRYIEMLATETSEERERRLARDRESHAKRLIVETVEQRERRLAYLREYRNSETENEREERLARKREYEKQRYALKKAQMAKVG
jgi:hypothetical protein